MQSSFISSPRHYAIDEFRNALAAISFDDWKPAFPTLHNTGVPSLVQWMSMGATPQERWGSNLNRYYAGLAWHAGPHLVVCPDYVWILSELTQPGVSVSCWNSITFGIEMVGNYEVGGDEFDSGQGAKVRDLAVRVLAAIADKVGWNDLSDFSQGSRGLHFHRECVRDHHACPGSKVSKQDMLARITEIRNASSVFQGRSDHQPAVVKSAEPYLPLASVSVEMMQSSLNKVGTTPALVVDGVLGPATRAALESFQRSRGLLSDWTPGPRTCALLAKTTAGAV